MSMNPESLLTPAEAQQVDLALMTSRDKFATRLAIYAWRILQDMVDLSGEASLESLDRQKIQNWLATSPTARSLLTDHGLEWDEQFLEFWTNLIDSAKRSLQTVSDALGIPVLELTVPQIIEGFERQAKAAVDSQGLS